MQSQQPNMMMNVGVPQQQGQQQMQMGNGMHRGVSPMLQQQMQQQGMMNQMQQQQHGPPPSSGPDGPNPGGMTQAQLQARMQMDSIHHGQSPLHHHAQQQQQQMGQGGPGPGGVHPHMQQQQQQQQQAPHGASGGGGGMNDPHQQQRDNISRAKQLLPHLKESLSNVMRTGAQTLFVNNMIDSGSKPMDVEPNRFDRSLEEFYSLCDQMEMHLRTSIECIAQGSCSSRYLPTPVTQTKMDNSITYHQYISTVKNQISFAKEVHDVLTEASQKMVD